MMVHKTMKRTWHISYLAAPAGPVAAGTVQVAGGGALGRGLTAGAGAAAGCPEAGEQRERELWMQSHGNGSQL